MTKKTDAYPPEEFNFWSESEMANPFEMYASLRGQCPVGRSNQLGGFAFASTYENAKRVLNDFATFSSRNGMVLPPRPERTYPSDLDPPEQNKYRRAINRAFTAQEVERVQPKIDQLVNDLIDGFVERGEADLAEQLIRPALPVIVMPMIGVPLADHDQIRGWIKPILRDRVSDPEGVVRAAQELSSHLEELVERRRSMPPQEDALGALLAYNVAGEPLPNKMIAGTLIALLLGGLDTTAAVALEALLYLASNPRDAERLRRGEVTWSEAIDEFLRLSSPPSAILRTVVNDMEFEGVHLRQGEFIMALVAAANRDPTHFPDAERCLIDRGENDHLAFGNGAHICVGRFLARAELEAFLKAVLTRMPDFRPIEGFEPEYWITSTRAMKSLPVVFTPGERIGRTEAVEAAA